MNGSQNNKALYITGGGGLSKNALNISTLASIVVASAGIKVIKHVSYEGSKKCTSALFLKEMGARVCTNISETEQDFEKYGIAFVEAQKEYVLDNLCPVLTMGCDIARFIGINNPDLAMSYLFELKNKGCNKAIVAVPTDENFDEISLCSSTQIFELINEQIKNYIVSPIEYTFEETEPISLTGATPLYNINLSQDILSGKIKDAKLDVLAFNVGVMLYIVGAAVNIQKGIMAAYHLIESGRALSKFEQLRRKKFC